MKILFETERLIVRHWQMKDCKDLFEYCSDESVTKFLNFTPYKTLEEAKDTIKKSIEKYKTEKIKVDCAIVLKETGKVIGSLFINNFKPSAGGVAKIGYILSPKFQGRGYATEAVKGLFKYIKQNNIAKRIEGACDTENTKSAAVMKRAGMTFEGIRRKDGQNNFHTRCDMEIYSILWEEIDV